MKLKEGDYIDIKGLTVDEIALAFDAFLEIGRGFKGDITPNSRYLGVDCNNNVKFCGSRRPYTESLFDVDPNLISFEDVVGTDAQYPTAEDEEFKRIEKQARYTNENGKDLIDKWAEHHTPEDFRLIMLTMIEKYMSRMGRKDAIAKECRKIADYANRLAIVEEGRK